LCADAFLQGLAAPPAAAVKGRLSPSPLHRQPGWWCDRQLLGGCWNFDELISSLYHRALTEITGSCEQLAVLAASPRTHKRN